MRFKGKFTSLILSFLYAGLAQAYQKPKCRDPEAHNCEFPKKLNPLFDIIGFTYIPDPLKTIQADNQTTGGGGGTGNIGAPGKYDDPDNYPDDEFYDEEEGEEDDEYDNYDYE